MLSRLNFIKRVAPIPNPKQIPETLKAIRETLPQEYLEEMEGIVEGFNKWSSGQFRLFGQNKITLDDLLFAHLMPDAIHFLPKQTEQKLFAGKSKSAGLACTVVIDRDEKNGITFGRNMDWASFGNIGEVQPRHKPKI